MSPHLDKEGTGKSWSLYTWRPEEGGRLPGESPVSLGRGEGCVCGTPQLWQGLGRPHGGRPTGVLCGDQSLGAR